MEPVKTPWAAAVLLSLLVVGLVCMFVIGIALLAELIGAWALTPVVVVAVAVLAIVIRGSL